MTRNQLNCQRAMSLDAAIGSVAQAICMQARNFERGVRAFVMKQRPVFERS